MSNGLRRNSMQRRAEKDAGRELANDAMKNHAEGCRRAREELQSALDDVGADGKRELGGTVGVFMRPAPVQTAGCATIVSLREITEEGPRHHQEIMVATMRDPIKATDKAGATPVSFTTKVATIIDDGDAGKFFTPLWETCTTKVVD